MAQVHDVILREPMPGPGVYANKHEALALNPTMVVVAAVYPADFPTEEVVEDGNTVVRRSPFSLEEQDNNKSSAENAAYRLNAGLTKKWPDSIYYGYAAPEVAEDGSPTGRYTLMVGLKDHMPEGWRAKVESAGARQYNKAGKNDSFEDEEPAEDAVPVLDEDDEEDTADATNAA